MGCEMGSTRPTRVFERAGESRMTPPASSISSQVRPRILLLAPAGVVGEVEDVLPRGGQVGADGEVFGVLEEALAGGILAQPVGEAGHGVEPAQWTASVHIRWSAEVSRLMVPVAAPAARRAS